MAASRRDAGDGHRALTHAAHQGPKRRTPTHLRGRRRLLVGALPILVGGASTVFASRRRRHRIGTAAAESAGPRPSGLHIESSVPRYQGTRARRLRSARERSRLGDMRQSSSPRSSHRHLQPSFAAVAFANLTEANTFAGHGKVVTIHTWRRCFKLPLGAGPAIAFSSWQWESRSETTTCWAKR